MPAERSSQTQVSTRRSAVHPPRPVDEQAARLGLLFDSNLMAIVYWDGSGRIVEANQALLGLIGRTREELLSGEVNIDDVLPLEHRRLLERPATGAAPSPSRAAFEGRLLTRSGQDIPVLLGGTVDPRADEPSMAFALDIRDRKYAEQSQQFIAEAGRVLASSLDYAQTLEQVAHLAVPSYADWCFVDILQEDGCFERLVVAHASPEHTETAQSLKRSYPRQSLGPKGMSWESEMHVGLDDAALSSQAKARPHLELLRGLGIRSYMIIPLVARQQLIGSLLFASTHWNYDAANLGCAEELARRAALAIDNARLYREAQEATRAREEFLSMASHELKTPLSSLKLQVQSLQRMLAPPDRPVNRERIALGLEMIKRQVDRQAKLVDTLLDVSRISADRLALEPEEFELSQLVREAVGRFDSELTRSETQLHLACPPSVRVLWDRMRTDQVLTNLLSNAIKYGCHKPVDVTVELFGDEPRVRVTVRDRGIGISDKDRARIFGQFERAVSERNFGGFGLGLWISQRLVAAMGGRITVESTIGAGSTFCVELPLRMHVE